MRRPDFLAPRDRFCRLVAALGVFDASYAGHSYYGVGQSCNQKGYACQCGSLPPQITQCAGPGRAVSMYSPIRRTLPKCHLALISGWFGFTRLSRTLLGSTSPLRSGLVPRTKSRVPLCFLRPKESAVSKSCWHN